MKDKAQPTPKQFTLEDLARAEEEAERARERQRAAYLEGQKKLLTLVPDRFFAFAEQLRDGANRFNGAAKLPKGFHYSETAAVTTRDRNPNADFIVELRRGSNHAILAMRNMGRVGKPDALVIEGSGVAGTPPRVDRFKLRSEGLVKGEEGEIVWRTTCDGQQIDTPWEQLADRVLAVLATGELSRLWMLAPFGPSS